MDCSTQQQEALDAFPAWMRGDEQVFYLAGFAGTGKTTLARHFAEQVEGPVLYGAYTGKAAHVMRRNGCSGATTIHRLIYNPKGRSRARLLVLQGQLTDLLLGVEANQTPLRMEERELRGQIEEEKEALKHPCFDLNEMSEVGDAELVVIDECSMVNQKIGEDLLSFGTKVLVLGDPAQLPPVRGTGFFTDRKPDVMLTEIHRQARDNPIIELATRVRSGEELEPGEYGESRVADITEVEDADLAEIATTCDQVLCGTNKMRRSTNLRIRGLLGREGDLPVAGEKLVCLRNDHKVGLLNGEIWYVVEVHRSSDKYLDLTIRNDDGVEVEVRADTNPFLGYDPAFDHAWRLQFFDYGYAITVHKSQGSQWDHVMVLDQSKKFRSDSKRHLYTAITRAAERVQVFNL